MQYDEQWVMHCQVCQGTHQLYPYTTSHKGIQERNFLWALRADVRELSNIGEAREKLRDEVASYLVDRYGARWANHFAGKSKKTVWAELTDDGRAYPQLSTFYNHVSSYGLAYIFSEYLRYEKIDVVVRVLAVDDDELRARVAEIEDVELKSASIHDRIRATGVR